MHRLRPKYAICENSEWKAWVDDVIFFADELEDIVGNKFSRIHFMVDCGYLNENKEPVR